MRDEGQSLLCFGVGLTEHHEVVGVAREAEAESVEMPVQMVQDDVSQQRADDPSLGGANRGGLEDTVFHHACAKELLD